MFSEYVKDLGNNVPDKSWMLYLLELFDSGATNNNNHSPIELNLICQFNEYDNFWAIFAGVCSYKQREVAHSTYTPSLFGDEQELHVLASINV
jgi:hypothetical protein